MTASEKNAPRKPGVRLPADLPLPGLIFFNIGVARASVDTYTYCNAYTDAGHHADRHRVQGAGETHGRSVLERGDVEQHRPLS
jgi:hypothetical protein